MGKSIGFKCARCGAEVELASSDYDCPKCSGNLLVQYDLTGLKRRLKRSDVEGGALDGIWRYRELLPLDSSKYASPLKIGGTPLYRSRGIADELGLRSLYIKDDGRNPSASFKDRAGAIALARALERGEKVITGASTGNAASSLACLAAGTGIRTIIFVPKAAPVAKIAQLLVFGATVIAVDGTYDQAFDLCLQATAEYGWYNRNTGYNPFTREGKKTCAYEIVEQLGWKCPDKVIVPVGDGNIISGIWKGFLEFHALGWIDRLPQLIAVQGGKSDAIACALESNGQIPTVSGETVADSISVSLPRDGDAAVTAVRDSKGFAVRVADTEILESIPHLARREGVFAEPAAAAAVAGLRKAYAEGRIASDETVVVLITGNGLKDVASAMKTVGAPRVIAPEMAALRQLNLGS
ncbi:MAG: threonine synthase [Bdellovibrionales bacterium GWB1_55_8]|nr:MAG: threonine synthase [Bdellovibrionales bacterium GWB1_55_8]